MKSKNSAYIFLVIAMLLVGCNIGFDKSIINVMPVLVFALLRFVIAVTILAPQYWKPGPRLTKNEWLNLFAQAFFGTFWLWMAGIKHLQANVAGVFSAVMPIAAAFIGVVFLNETLTWAHLLALSCVLPCIVIASWPAERHLEVQPV